MFDRSGHTQSLRLVLYSLKREYGQCVSVYRNNGTTVNRETGVKTVNKEVFEVDRAPVLPVTISRQVKQSISLISSNKEFVVGGQHVRGQRSFILDAQDLPDDFTLKDDDWIVYRDRRYDIASFDELDLDGGWIITGQERPDVRPEQIYPLSVDDYLSLSSDVVKS